MWLVTTTKVLAIGDPEDQGIEQPLKQAVTVNHTVVS